MKHTARRAQPRRALRATLSLTGLAALGVSLTGTAYAATPAPDHGLTDQARQQDATAMPNRAPSRTTSSLDQQGLHSFQLPGATPSGTAMPAANPLRSEDSDDNADEARASSSDPDDVYPRCAPVYDKHDYSALGYNGDKRDDEEYGSDDEDPDCTGFHGKSEDNGYNGYLGKDKDRLDENHYRFAPL